MRKILFAAAMLLSTFAVHAGTMLSFTGLSATPLTNGQVLYVLHYTNAGSASASFNMALMQGSIIEDEQSRSGVTGDNTITVTLTATTSGPHFIITWGFDDQSNAAFSDTMWIVTTIQSNAGVENIFYSGSNPAGNCRIISLSGNVVGEYKNTYFADCKKNFLHDFSNGTIYLFDFISDDRTLVVHDKLSTR